MNLPSPASGFQLIGGQYTISKDPDSKLDYGIRLGAWLVAGDSISPSVVPVWVISDDLQKLAEGVFTDPTYGPTAFIKLGGGGARGTTSWARCHWTTTQGREEEQTLYFRMVDK